MKMHFIGCKGVSMSVLMDIIKSNAISVSGSDSLLDGHNKCNIKDADVVVYTAAIPLDNEEFVEAKRRGIPLIERAELLGQISSSYDRVVAVAGSHGKTTTTAMIGAILDNCDPTIHVGGIVVGVGGSRVGSKRYFVTEACEYKRGFLSLEPAIGVILNTDLDHTDYYKDYDDYVLAFNQFSKNSNTVVVNESCKHIVDKNKHTITFGERGDYQVKNISLDRQSLKTKFEVTEYGNTLGQFDINCFGLHNVYNALASITVARALNMDLQDIKTGLNNFLGVKRRFEIVKRGQQGVVINDYAHHPKEIVATIQTAKELTESGKVRVLFQPHTYTRTQSMAKEFAEALSSADQIGLVPIYAARELAINGVTHHTIGDKIPNSVCFDSLDDAKEFLDKGDDGDITIVMGAGDIENILN